MNKRIESNPKIARKGQFSQEQLSRLSEELASLKDEADARLTAMKALGIEAVTIDSPPMASDGLVKIKVALSRVDVAIYEESQNRVKNP